MPLIPAYVDDLVGAMLSRCSFETSLNRDLATATLATDHHASLVLIRQAPTAVQNTIQPTITSDAAKVDSGISR